MSIVTTFRWEQDGNGGDHGKATYFPGSLQECCVTMPTFLQAFQLQEAIEARLKIERRAGRYELRAQIEAIPE